MKYYLTTIILFAFHIAIRSQDLQWEVIINEVEGKDIPSNFSIRNRQSGDSVTIMNNIATLISDMRTKGFILANLDSIKFDSAERRAEAWIYSGNQFQWGNVTLRSVKSKTPFDLNRFELNHWNGKEVSISKIEASIKNVIEYHENRGYPFASISWDSIRISERRISAELLFDPGPYIVYDSVSISGGVRINPGFLASYMDVNPGKAYKERSINNIPDRLESLEYLKMKSPPGITFQNEEARIILPLEKVSANRFDAVIGILPNQTGGKGVLITGAIDLSLKNLFQSGKELEFHWDHIQKQTQTLALAYQHPNLFHSPLGLMGSFFLYKQDTSFLNRKMEIGFDYKTGRYGKLYFKSKWESSRLINSEQFSGSLILPDVADYNISSLVAAYTDVPFRGLMYGSKKTWGVTSELSAGSKKIIKNNRLDQGLYDDLDLNSIQFSGKISIQGIHNFRSGPYALLGRLSGGIIKNDQLFLNDLFRLGGLKSIRGFNENTFYASRFLTATVEMHAYFNSISSIFLFYDQGHLSYNLSSSEFSDNPFGTGLGLSLESKNGIFSFVYAFGKSLEQPFSIRYSKIHFGYKAIF